MADIKREDITLQDWTKWISADEFWWWSYFYAEWISSGYNTKWFELWSRVTKTAINSRAAGYSVAIAPTRWGVYWMASFTHDWMIELENEYNGERKWAMFSRWRNGYESDRVYKNWLSYWDLLIGITNNHIDVVNTSEAFSSEELLTEPTFNNWWAAWTVGSWWSITSNGAEHTSGTGTLTTAINFSETPTSDVYLRVAVRIADTTWGWRLAFGLDAPISQEVDFQPKNWWMVLTLRCNQNTTSLIITPTTNFVGTIKEVNVCIYNNSWAEFNKATIYGSSDAPKPAIIWEWDLYVASGNYVNIYSLQDWGRTYKALVDRNFTIVSMTQQAWNIIIWATDGFDSRQYYWNWVDAVASEVIEWKGLIIKWVTGTETISYVLTASGSTSWSVEWYEFRLYTVSGYQRNLIASKLYQYMSLNYLEEEPYNINKKFEFNDVESDNSMIVYLDSLYIPWCDGLYKYWYDVPWLRTNWTRPIRYDIWATHIVLWQRNDFLDIWYNVDGVNYIAQVNERLYTDRWYLITESIYWDKLSTRKVIEKMKIWYKSVDKSVGNIKLYAIVDDDYFWRFRPTTEPTNRPEIWDIYNVANDTTASVINVDKENWIITFKTEVNRWSHIWVANTTLTKVSWEWDDSIDVWYKFDNLCLIKTIETDGQWYGSDFIFWKDFVKNYIPYWHKIQFVIEINSNNYYISPEIYEISLVSDITDTVL